MVELLEGVLPLLAVVALAGLLIRDGHSPLRHNVRTGRCCAHDAARQDARRDFHDTDFDGGGAGSGDGGGD